MRKNIAVLAGVSLALSGCANLSTVGRSTPLTGDGVAVHLDAPQRVVVANKKGWACAEPSPDALQAYASSLGVGFAAPTKESVSIAQALSTSAGSIGLRTQSITLMRDALYRICELYFNEAISKEAAVQLLQRSQDLSLAILAIEQLTGAVVAQQVNLNMTSAASAAATINDTQKELDRAKADEAAKKTAAEESQAASEAQKKVVTEKTTDAAAAKAKAKETQAAIDRLTPGVAKAQEALDSALGTQLTQRLEAAGIQKHIQLLQGQQQALTKQVADLHAKGDAAGEKVAQAKLDKVAAGLTEAATALAAQQKKVDEAGTEVETAQQKYEELNAQLTAAKAEPLQVAADKASAAMASATADQKKKDDAAEAAKKTFEEAQANTREIQKLGVAATSAANASGSGSGAFSTSTSRYGVNKDTVEALTKATTDILRTVAYKGHMTDSCMVMLMSDQRTAGLNPDALAFCKQIIEASTYVYRATLGGLQTPGQQAAPAATRASLDPNVAPPMAQELFIPYEASKRR